MSSFLDAIGSYGRSQAAKGPDSLNCPSQPKPCERPAENYLGERMKLPCHPFDDESPSGLLPRESDEAPEATRVPPVGV